LKHSKKAAAVLVAAAVALPLTGSIADAKSGKPKPVQVVDDFFAPTSVSVKSGTKLPFKWDKSNTNSHNVTLKTGPNGVKKSDFKSPTGSIGVKFAPTFKKKGTYDFLCTIHPDTMTLTVTVKG
jgi:plastocyanin